MTEQPTIDSALFRTVLGHFCSGITIIAAVDGGEPVGFTCQSFASLSLEPPLVLFCPANSSSSWPRIKASGRFCANILAADQEPLGRLFAKSGADKFGDVDWKPTAGTGSPRLPDVLAWIDGELIGEFDGGDHVIAVGRVVDLAVERETEPLLFWRGEFGRYSSLPVQD